MFNHLINKFTNDLLSYLESDYAQDDDDRSSPPPLFYEKPGIPELVDDVTNDTRRVKFSTAPIRVRQMKKMKTCQR